VCFTALPIIMLAIFDRGGLSAASLENDPRAYLSIAHGFFFNDSLFSGWILRAFWNAIWVFGIVYLSVGLDDVSGSAGRNHGLWLTSTVIYTAITLLVTLRILLECQSINTIVLFFVVASFAGYFPVVYFANTLRTLNPNLFGVFDEMFQNVFVWFVLIMCIAVPLMVDVARWSWRRYLAPSYFEVLQERQRLSKSELLRLDQESVFAGSNARVRTRTVPHLSQQQKDAQLLGKVRRALQQAQQESARQATTENEDNSQKRAEALGQWERFRNFSLDKYTRSVACIGSLVCPFVSRCAFVLFFSSSFSFLLLISLHYDPPSEFVWLESGRDSTTKHPQPV
jgi:magnesium-transporting ATPase (P-type)